MFGNVHGESECSDSDNEPPPKLANIPHQNAHGQTVGEWVFKPKKGGRSRVPKSAQHVMVSQSTHSPSTVRVIQGAPVAQQPLQIIHSPQHQQIQLLQPAPIANVPIAIQYPQPQPLNHQIPRVYTSAVGGWYLSCHQCPPPTGLFTAATRGACVHIGLVNGNGGLLVSEPLQQPTAYYTQYIVAGRHIAIANNNPREILLFQDGAWRPATVPLVMQTPLENSGNRIQLIS